MNQTKRPLNYAYSPSNSITGMSLFFSFCLVEYTSKLLKVFEHFYFHESDLPL